MSAIVADTYFVIFESDIIHIITEDIIFDIMSGETTLISKNNDPEFPFREILADWHRLRIGDKSKISMI